VPFSILVVEDNPVVGEIVQSTLERRGHKVVVTRSTKQAVEWLGNYKCQMVLLDVLLSHVDGGQFLPALLQMRLDAGMPIIAFSAFSSGKMDLRHDGTAFDDYIPNVRDPDKLARTVEEHLLATADPFAI